MGYSETLDVIARLHMDLTFRAAFLADPEGALAPLGLTADERRALAGLDPEALDRMGRLSEYHRLTRIQEHVTWADLALRPELLRGMARYMTATVPPRLNREEAIAYCRFLEAAGPSEPPYLAELARYERLRLTVAWGLEPELGTSHVAAFQYPVPRLLELLASPGWPQVEPQPTTLEFKKVPGLPAVLIRARA